MHNDQTNCYNFDMNRETVDILNQLNESFYRNNSDSFDSSRQTAWPGWDRVIEHLEPTCRHSRLRLLDVASGNMRFEKHLARVLPQTTLLATCVDSCGELACEFEGCDFVEMDVVAALVQGESPAVRWGDGYDAVASFGFFHHVPSTKLRQALLAELVAATAPHGLVAVSLWRFASDDKMRAKAERTTAEAIASTPLEAHLEDGDYLIGWNNVPGVFRYCHSFDKHDVDALAASVPDNASLVDRFKSDGRTGSLNEYLVFRKH